VNGCQRTFRYALEPVRQKKLWALDAARVQLAGLEAQLAACEQAMLRLTRRCEEEAIISAEAWQRYSDPRARSAALAHLAALRRQLANLAGRAACLRDEVTRARSACRARNTEVEAIEEHRRLAAQEMRAGAARRALFEADADWVMRAARHPEGAP
jgi:hypothetical protein